MRLILRIALPLLFLPLLYADSITGRVYETAHCSGLTNAVVRFTPPKQSGLPTVVTSTDSTGAFSADLQSNREYYVSVYFGTQQLYGRVLTVSARPLLIALRSSNDAPGANCTQASGIDLRNRFKRPDAITRGTNGKFYLLDATTQGEHLLVVLVPEGNAFIVDREITLDPSLVPIDLTFAVVDSKESIFVLGKNPLDRAVLYQYADINTKPKTWSLGDLVSGIAIDPTNNAVYLARPRHNDIRKLDLRTGAFSFVAELGESETPPLVLGPTTIDVPHRKLYVADIQYGKLYEVDLTTGKKRRIAQGLGNPSALTLDQKAQVLYVADGGRTIWALHLGSSSKVAVFSRQRSFRELTGLSLGSNDTLWVTDPSVGALFHVSSDGGVLQRWP